MTTHVLWLGNLTIFDSTSKSSRGILVTLCLSIYSHMYYVSGQYNSSMNNKHLSWYKEINNTLLLPLGHISFTIGEEVAKLLAVYFSMEVFHPEWMANPVLVLKKNKTWRMCIDYTSLNKACPKCDKICTTACWWRSMIACQVSWISDEFWIY